MARKAKRRVKVQAGLKLSAAERREWQAVLGRMPCRVDEYRSRTAARLGSYKLNQDIPELAGRRLPDPAPCGRPEHVAAWQLN